MKKAVGLLGLLVLLGPGPALCFERLFDARMDFQTGATWGKLVLADLNRDGVQDLLQANGNRECVTVLLGSGDGTFLPARDHAVETAPGDLCIGDFNEDGLLDAVTANRVGEGSISLLLGKGDGTFWPARHTALGAWASSPHAVLADDFDGDGRLDVAVGMDSWHASVALLRGTGTGFFLPASLHLPCGDYVTSLASGDLNHDLIADLVVTGCPAGWNVSVLLGSSSGEFSAPQSLAAGSGARSARIAFLDGDAHPDLAVANQSGDDTVSVFLGTGDGTFGDAAAFEAGDEPYSVHVADLNGDGRADLASANYRGDDVSVLLGAGDGTFWPAVGYPTGAWPRYVVSGDLDGDAVPDLIVTGEYSDTVSILAGAGDGTFSAAVNLTAGSFPGEPLVADLNGDGHPDLAAANDAGANVSVFLGAGGGAFLLPGVCAPGLQAAQAALGDLDGNLDDDLVLVDAGAGSLARLRGNGDGTFDPPVVLDAGESPSSFALFDFNRDGRADLAVANTITPATESSTVSLLFGNGDGTFQAPVPYAVGTTARWVAVGDVSNDGTADLVVANQGSHDVTVLKGIHDGTFYDVRSYPAGPGPFSVSLGDLSGDGVPDLAVANAGVDPDQPAGVSVLINNGVGTFPSSARFLEGVLPGSVLAGDLTGDGAGDVLVTQRIASWLLQGNGDGTFRDPLDLDQPATDACRTDLDGDGRSDLVLSHAVGNRVTVLFGSGPVAWEAAAQYYGTRGGPSFLAAGDANGDGWTDLLAAGEDGVTVLLNRLAEAVCRDGDGDGFGTPGSIACPHPQADCDDANPDVNPLAGEGPSGDVTCADGLDNDCDGRTDAGDLGCASPDYLTASHLGPAGPGARVPSGLLNQAVMTAGPLAALVLLRRRARGPRSHRSPRLLCRRVRAQVPGGAGGGVRGMPTGGGGAAGRDAAFLSTCL